MQCYVCHTTRPPAGGLWSTTHEAVAVCQHCGAGVCASHAQRANIPGAPIYCETCLEVVTAAEQAAAASASTAPRLARSY